MWQVVKNTVSDLAQGWLDHLAPCYCWLCGMRSNRQICLCAACELEIPLNYPACSHCALPLLAADLSCGACLQTPPPVSRALVPRFYAEPVSGLVQALKFSRDFSTVPILVELMLAEVEHRLLTIEAPDALVPMPMHWRRRLRRGFNQAELIASALCAHPRLRNRELAVNNKLCRRQRATTPQLGLNAADRRRNLVGAFACSNAVTGMKLALVDDVLTTGASAHAAASALLQAGASEVELWCCARTPNPGLVSANPG